MECFRADVDAVSPDGSWFQFGMRGKKTTELANRQEEHWMSLSLLK